MLCSTTVRFYTSKTAPNDQNKFVRITHLALCCDGKNSAYSTTDWGAPPMPKPTRPLRIKSHIKIGEIADNAPK